MDKRAKKQAVSPNELTQVRPVENDSFDGRLNQKISRRKAISTGVTAGIAVAGLVVGGAAGYLAGSSVAPQAPAKTITQTQTVTPTATTTEGPVKFTQGQGVFTIGTSISTSGPTAPAVSKVVDMLNSWATLVNNHGGIYAEDMGGYIPVKVIVYPDGGPGDLGTVRANYTRLATQDKVDLLLGPFAAALSETASPIAVQNTIPYIDTDAAEIPIYSQPDPGNWIVGSINIINFYTYGYLKVLKEQTDAKTIALMDLGDDFGTEGNGTGSSHFGNVTFAKQFGFDVVTNGSDHINQSFAPNFDYTAEVQRMKSLDPDVIIFIETTGVFQGQFWLACKAAGYKPRAYHPIFATSSAFQGIIGPDLVNGLSGDDTWDSRLNFEGLWGKKLWQELQTAAGFDARQWTSTPAYYTALQIACSAVISAGSTDKSKVRDALNSIEVETLNGPWRAQKTLTSPITAPSDVTTGHGMGLFVEIPVQIISGTKNILGPAEIATAPYVYPQPTSF
jgi:branched-chain amino acid transport system substrate-binding protein